MIPQNIKEDKTLLLHSLRKTTMPENNLLTTVS